MRMLLGVSETERVRTTSPTPSRPHILRQKTEMWAKVYAVFWSTFFAVAQLRVGKDFAQTKNGDVHKHRAPIFQGTLQPPSALYTVVTKITHSFHVVDVEVAAAAVTSLPPKTKM